MPPRKLIIKAVGGCFNRADVETITALYADNVVNHQVVNQPVESMPCFKPIMLPMRGCAFHSAILEWNAH